MDQIAHAAARHARGARQGAREAERRARPSFDAVIAHRCPSMKSPTVVEAVRRAAATPSRPWSQKSAINTLIPALEGRRRHRHPRAAALEDRPLIGARGRVTAFDEPSRLGDDHRRRRHAPTSVPLHADRRRHPHDRTSGTPVELRAAGPPRPLRGDGGPTCVSGQLPAVRRAPARRPCGSGPGRPRAPARCRPGGRRERRRRRPWRRSRASASSSAGRHLAERWIAASSNSPMAWLRDHLGTRAPGARPPAGILELGPQRPLRRRRRRGRRPPCRPGRCRRGRRRAVRHRGDRRRARRPARSSPTRSTPPGVHKLLIPANLSGAQPRKRGHQVPTRPPKGAPGSMLGTGSAHSAPGVGFRRRPFREWEERIAQE